LIATLPIALAIGDTAIANAARPGELVVAQLDRLAERERQPADGQRHPDEQPRAQRLAGQQHGGEQRDVQRQRSEEHGRQPRRNVLLGPVDEAVGRRERQRPEQHGERHVGAQRAAPRGLPRQQPAPGEHEAHARAEQRRQVLEADLDRHPRARPDEDEHRVQRPDQTPGHAPRLGRRGRGGAQRSSANAQTISAMCVNACG
jgi:hypothetical protein